MRRLSSYCASIPELVGRVITPSDLGWSMICQLVAN